MRKFASAFLILSSCSAVAYAAPASFICTSPTGYAEYTSENSGWNADGMNGGLFELTFDGKSSEVAVGYGKPVKKLSTEGAMLPLFEGPTFFALAVIYVDAGILENFAVSKVTERWRLSWTQIRDGDMSRQPNKVAAYSADCVKK